MRVAVFVAAGLVVLTSFLRADSDDDDEDTGYFPLVPTGNSLRYGLRYVGGPKVAFHDVGTIPPSVIVYGTTDGVLHTYNDGTVSPDARTAPNGHPVNDGLTNTWSINYSDQVGTDSVGNNTVAFHVYSATSDVDTIKARTTDASGWELQVGRSLGKIARKVDVSLVGGFTFSSVNAKRTSWVQSNLITMTDTYQVDGLTAPTAPYTAPVYVTEYIYDQNGQTVLDSSGAPKTKQVPGNTILLNLNPTRTYSPPTGTSTTVSGFWQVKGAYYTFRVGPMFQVPVTERIKMSVEFGGGAAYVGTTFSVNELMLNQEVLSDVQNVDQETRNLLLPLVYVDADAEYWLTERAGLYLGASYQKSGSFHQSAGGESAAIDMESTSGLTTGLTLRF